MIEYIDRHEKWHNISDFWKSSREIGKSLASCYELSDNELEILKNYLNDNTHSSIILIDNQYIYRDWKWNPSWFLYTKLNNWDLMIWLFKNSKLVEWIICYWDNNDKKMYEIWKFDENNILIEWDTIYPNDIRISTSEANQYNHKQWLI